MQALRRLARIRRGVANHALVAILAISGVGLIAYAAVAQDSPNPCVGPDCLGNDPAPEPGDGGFSLPRFCSCDPATTACLPQTGICPSLSVVRICCGQFLTPPLPNCQFTTVGAPLPVGCP